MDIKEGYKESFLSLTNIFFGGGTIAYLLFPKDWRICGSMAESECLATRMVNNQSWVTSGHMRLRLNTLGKPSLDLSEAIVFTVKIQSKRSFDVDDWIKRKLRKLKKKNIRVHEVVHIWISEHKSAYVLWTKRRKSHWIFGELQTQAELDFRLPCDITQRVIHVNLWTKHDHLIFDNREKLLTILSSLACHCPLAEVKTQPKIVPVTITSAEESFRS
jgi:hypothetical protein